MNSDRKPIAHFLENLSLQLLNGCGNHGCVINPPKGMGTNSTCKCEGYLIKRELEWIVKQIPNKWETEK